ncbi:polyphosphate kinase 2 [Motiliproteus sediminis]|uniref:polyphosphate kinase 2 n=1 Tax=Motiliproteus sediminis TaxID=1468178 RepID=UPI001FE77DE2|nr:polyphosphate kinase 2 [Motiliproteus sediminis]
MSKARTSDSTLLEQEEIAIESMQPKTEVGSISIRKHSKFEERGDHPEEGKDRRKSLPKLKNSEYLELIAPLHVELLKLQNWVKENNIKVCCLFEGRDAAGKGGTIKRVIEHLNPRGCRVVALEKPSEREQTQWYFQRYVSHLPAGGEIVLFDRSWYNRAGVERVMNFATQAQVIAHLHATPDFEKLLLSSGIHLLKFWFSVSKSEQQRRFKKRETDPLKQWKLSPIDKESQDKWDDYSRAKEDMFFYTSIPESPWIIIKSDDKKRARINCIRYLLSQFEYSGKDHSLLELDRRIVKTVRDELP